MAQRFRSMGFGFNTMLSSRELVGLAQRAEALGVRRFWLAEEYHYRSATTLAAAVAQATRKIEIGLGVISPFTRHPGILAMEAATLSELSGGRIVLGLGAALIGLRSHRRIGKVPLAAGMRDAVGLTRRLLAGEEVSAEGGIWEFDAGRLAVTADSGDPRARRVPVFAGVMSPRNLRMAGEIADGVLFGVFCTPAFVRQGVADIRAGATAAGRNPDDLEIGSYMLTGLGNDRATRDAVKDTVAAYLCRVGGFILAGLRAAAAARAAGKGEAAGRLAWAEVPSDRGVTAGLTEAELEGLVTRLSEAFRREDRAALRAALPETLVDHLAIVGDAEQIAERLIPYAEAGLSTIVPYHILGADRAAAMEDYVKQVVPRVCTGN